MEPVRGGGKRLLPEDGVKDISRRPEDVVMNCALRAAVPYIPIQFDGGLIVSLAITIRRPLPIRCFGRYGSDGVETIAMIEWQRSKN
jgi:hypothetical protein